MPLSPMNLTPPDFWLSSGYALLDRTTDGYLLVTDDYLRHLLGRPEIAPIAASCSAEVALHEGLLQTPRRTVSADELAALQDRDAADNYAVWLRFRARLLAKQTLEASYMALFEGAGVDVPPVLVQQLTQTLLRHVLAPQPGGGREEHARPRGGAVTNADEVASADAVANVDAVAIDARAAEMLFRPQKISILEDGVVMAADEDTVERHATSGGFGSLGELLKQGGVPLRSVDLDVLGNDNAGIYWDRSEAFDLVVSLNHGQPALQALCHVMERWIAHFLGVAVRIQTDREIVDSQWVWHVGLDAQASSVLNDLYNGLDVGEDRMRRLLCLFRLEFCDPGDMRADLAGRPVYLAMAMDAQGRLKLKPQNLLLNLPLNTRVSA